MMAKTDAENQKAYRERQKKKLGVAEYKRLEHEAYLRRKDKLKAARDKKKFAGKQIQSYLLYRDLRKQLIEMELSVIGAPDRLDRKRKDIIEVRAMKMVQLVIEKNMTSWKAFEEVHNNYQEINLFPALGTEFFKEVSGTLDEQEQEVWEYIYQLLFWQERIENEKVTDIARHTETSKEEVLSTLKKLVTMRYLKVTEFDTHFTEQYLSDRFDRLYKKNVKPKRKSLFASDWDVPAPEDIEEARQEYLNEKTSFYLSTEDAPHFLLERGDNWIDYEVEQFYPR